MRGARTFPRCVKIASSRGARRLNASCLAPCGAATVTQRPRRIHTPGSPFRAAARESAMTHLSAYACGARPASGPFAAMRARRRSRIGCFRSRSAPSHSGARRAMPASDVVGAFVLLPGGGTRQPFAAFRKAESVRSEQSKRWHIAQKPAPGGGPFGEIPILQVTARRCSDSS